MMRLPTVLFFVVLTFLCWGAYGPVLHLGQIAMDHSRWRPFICVGLAYFVIAVVVPLILLRSKPESGRWTLSGITWSFTAGVVGAIGALGIILAFQFGGRPVFVMPIVFGCAPVVNTLVTMFLNPNQRDASIPFLLAIGLVALGAAGVFVFKPAAVTATKTEAALHASDLGTETPPLLLRSETPSADAIPTVEAQGGFFNGIKALLAVVMTAICWGAYGPMLHKGQGKMEGSRLRPFICVGLAYFLIAVVVPVMVLCGANDGAHFTFVGAFWSLLAGAVGAVGALGIIMAFNFGGRPVFVMPLVFGGAPIINTLISMGQSYWKSGQFGQITPQFLISLAMVITGAVLVLLFAPKPTKQRVPVNPLSEDAAIASAATPNSTATT